MLNEQRNTFYLVLTAILTSKPRAVYLFLCLSALKLQLGVFLMIWSIKHLENPTSESAFNSDMQNLSNEIKMGFQSVFKTF